MVDDKQPALFDMPEGWRETWQGMPDYDHRDLSPYQSIKVHFANEHDRAAFAELIGQPISDLTKFVWYPKADIGRIANKRWHSVSSDLPKYPIYVVSKGRWESRLTAKSLEAIGVPYRIVVEPQEAWQYARVIDPQKILLLPFHNLGQGSIPARNWIWDHAVASGAKRHWILDDNIDGFYRFQDNLKVQVSSPSLFVAAEDFADRYENVALAGFNYFMFAKRKFVIPPFTLNTRIYSCILIDCALPHRWRGRYNEDTDLSLRALKDGYCTVLFNAFLAMKMSTMTMTGGNSDELYQGDGRLEMAESLRAQHPDVVTVTRKFKRWQHSVNYSPFKRNQLRLAADAPEPRSAEMNLSVTRDDTPATP